MPCRLTSSTKTPWPWTSRPSSLRGMLFPAWPASSWVCSGARTVSVTGGRLDRADDVHVAGAPADVALDPPADLLLGRPGVLFEEVRRADQHAGRAVAALERVVLRKRPLQRRQFPVRREPLDRSDLGPVRLHCQ